jgi:hypothetical protein
MNRTLQLIPALLLIATFSSGQKLVTPNRPALRFNTDPGYITINEITGGPGLGIVNAPFAKYFVGFTTVHGYQINQSFVVAAGTGFSAYNGGNLIPLFIDLRYRILIGSVTPYIAGDGGALFNLAGGATRFFINPSLGVRYTVNRKIGLNISSGLFIQKDNQVRDSYLNFKVGITYMPQLKKDRTKPAGYATGTKSPSTGKSSVKTASVPATTVEKKPTTNPVNTAKPPEKVVQNLNAPKPEPETKKIDTLKTKISVPETKKIDSLKNNTPVPETKKIEPAKTPATSTVAKKEAVVFRIQFVSNKDAKGTFKVTISGKVYDTFEYFYAGAYRSTVGEFSTYADAVSFQQAVRQSGYPQAFVVVFKNNIRSTDPSLLK